MQRTSKESYVACVLELRRMYTFLLEGSIKDYFPSCNIVWYATKWKFWTAHFFQKQNIPCPEDVIFGEMLYNYLRFLWSQVGGNCPREKQVKPTFMRFLAPSTFLWTASSCPAGQLDGRGHLVWATSSALTANHPSLCCAKHFSTTALPTVLASRTPHSNVFNASMFSGKAWYPDLFAGFLGWVQGDVCESCIICIICVILNLGNLYFS